MLRSSLRASLLWRLYAVHVISYYYYSYKTIIINITITTRMALTIALRNHSHELRFLSMGVSRTAWSQHGKSSAIFFQRQLNNTFCYQCKESVERRWKARDEWAVLLSASMLSHCVCIHSIHMLPVPNIAWVDMGLVQVFHWRNKSFLAI